MDCIYFYLGPFKNYEMNVGRRGGGGNYLFTLIIVRIKIFLAVKCPENHDSNPKAINGCYKIQCSSNKHGSLRFKHE